MRIFRICPKPNHLDNFRKKTNLSIKSYDDQISILKAENFMLPGGWSKSMSDLGHIIFETLFDDQLLNSKWLLENDKTHILHKDNWLLLTLEEQLKLFLPDVVFIYAGAFNLIDKSIRKNIKLLLNYNVIITGFWGDELPNNTTYSDFFSDIDFIFTSNSKYSEYFCTAGIEAFTNGNAFDTTI